MLITFARLGRFHAIPSISSVFGAPSCGLERFRRLHVILNVSDAFETPSCHPEQLGRLWDTFTQF
jgi:hypothetical protein